MGSSCLTCRVQHKNFIETFLSIQSDIDLTVLTIVAHEQNWLGSYSRLQSLQISFIHISSISCISSHSIIVFSPGRYKRDATNLSKLELGKMK